MIQIRSSSSVWALPIPRRNVAKPCVAMALWNSRFQFPVFYTNICEPEELNLKYFLWVIFSLLYISLEQPCKICRLPNMWNMMACSCQGAKSNNDGSRQNVRKFGRNLFSKCLKSVVSCFVSQIDEEHSLMICIFWDKPMGAV